MSKNSVSFICNDKGRNMSEREAYSFSSIKKDMNKRIVQKCDDFENKNCLNLEKVYSQLSNDTSEKKKIVRYERSQYLQKKGQELYNNHNNNMTEKTKFIDKERLFPIDKTIKKRSRPKNLSSLIRISKNVEEKGLSLFPFILASRARSLPSEPEEKPRKYKKGRTHSDREKERRFLMNSLLEDLKQVCGLVDQGKKYTKISILEAVVEHIDELRTVAGLLINNFDGSVGKFSEKELDLLACAYKKL